MIGAGPAGLSCAYQLARRGYPVTVFEGFSQPGGMLRYGIPKYRLPRDVLDGEIQRILRLGVDLQCNAIVGSSVSLDQLRGEYKAVFVGIGAHAGIRLRIPGDDAPNVFTGDGISQPGEQRRASKGGRQRAGDRRRRYSHRFRPHQQAAGRGGDHALPAHARRNAGHRAGDRRALSKKASISSS